MDVKNKSRQWVKESTYNTIHASIKKSVNSSQSTYVNTSVQIKQVNEDLKIFRRYSFDDNGGSYAGL
jgi:hypothetical protein